MALQHGIEGIKAFRIYSRGKATLARVLTMPNTCPHIDKQNSPDLVVGQKQFLPGETFGEEPSDNDKPAALSHPKYRPDIDGLRAIAVLSVVGYHAFPQTLTGGFVGVDVFFVISGFLISTIIFENLERSTFKFSEFYARRIKRIFPTLLVVLAACYAFGWAMLLPDEYEQLGKHMAGAALFVSNIILWKEAGYFDNSAESKPLLHFWSLGIEEQFYIIWPLLLWAAWKRKFNVPFVIVAVMLFSFLLNLNGVKNEPVSAFYLPQSRFWELLIGSLLAWLTLNKATVFGVRTNPLSAWLSKLAGLQTSGTWQNTASVIGLLLIACSIQCISKDTHFPGAWALLPTLGAVMIISAGGQAWLNRAVLSNRLVVWFGLISYPLYLWHWPVLSYARIVEGAPPGPAARLVLISVSVLLSWLTYQFVEKKIRFGAHSKRKVIALVALMVIAGSVGYRTYQREGLAFRPIAKKSMDFGYRPQRNYVPCGNELMSGDDQPSVCMSSLGEKLANAVIIGDSHADDKFFGLSENDRANTWMTMGTSSCPPLLGYEVDIGVRNCEAKTKKMLAWIRSNDQINTVVFSFWGNYFLTTPVAADQVEWWTRPDIIQIRPVGDNPKLSREQMFEVGLSNAIESVKRAGRKVILFLDLPELPYLPRDCFRKPYDEGCKLQRRAVDQRQAKLRGLVERVKTRIPDLLVYDPINYFCDTEQCRFQSDDVIIYRDSHHLTWRGSDGYAKDFLNWQRAALH